MAGNREKIQRLWTPPRRTPQQRRNARVKLVGTLLILVGVLAAAAVAWL